MPGGERTRIVNRIKATLARVGIRNFKPTLRKAAKRLATVHTRRACRCRQTPWPSCSAIWRWALSLASPIPKSGIFARSASRVHIQPILDKAAEAKVGLWRGLKQISTMQLSREELLMKPRRRARSVPHRLAPGRHRGRRRTAPHSAIGSIATNCGKPARAKAGICCAPTSSRKTRQAVETISVVGRSRGGVQESEG